MSSVVGIETQGNISVITLNNPPVNALSVNKGVPQGILDGIQQGEHDPKIKGFLLIGAGRNFSGGADISEFGKPLDEAMATLADLLPYMDTVTKPIFAALSGPTMGGGLELALACHYRCAAQDVALALPEVKLGILPGAGGTQRLPRLIGVERALDFMISGDPIGATEGKKLGIIDSIVDGDLRESAVAWAKQLMQQGVEPKRASELKTDIGNLEDSFFDSAKQRISKRWKGFPAPLAITECVEASTNQPFLYGIAFERQQFGGLVKGNESISLRHLFFSERLAAKIPDIGKEIQKKKINSAAVIGGGLMGGGITMNFANAGIPVTMVEMSEEAMEKGIGTIRKNYAATVAKGRLSQESMDERLSLISPSIEFEKIKDADIVIEAVYEDMSLKKEIFKKLDGVMNSNAILATNTSTLDINEIASVTTRPESVVGTHFFSPANVMRLLEVVRGDKTSKEVLSTAMQLGKTIKKIPVCVGVCDGFVGNRMIHHYSKEAGYLLEEGALPKQVDAAIESFGFAMGPFRMGDLAGLDIGWAIRKRQAANRPPEERYSKIPDMICELGRYGQKTGAGYYKYEPGKRVAIPDSEIEDLIVKASEDKGIQRREITDDEIIGRLLYSLVNEGARILEEGFAQRASDIDVIYAFGYGFPRYRGGPMLYADMVGLKKVVASIKNYSQGYKAEHWRVAPLLERLAEEDSRFNK